MPSTSSTDPPEPFGVYVHIPFCASRCDYCAFATWTDRHHLTRAYLDALITEIEQARHSGMRPASSVFVGGGTPSLIPADELARVLEAIPWMPGAEVTVECNPDDITEDLVGTYLRAGVSRISLGVQSMVPAVLQSLGRRHTPENVQRAVSIFETLGLENFNLDLIYGAAGESVDDWRRTVEAVLDLDPPHISSYGLTVEPGTPLADDQRRWPDDDDQADKYELCDDLLTTAGLENYEISNWARPGDECRHNLVYWTQGDYLGFGCAAHSHQAGRRWWNVRTPERYISLVNSGDTAEAASETLDDGTRYLEGLQLRLRMRGGIPTGHLESAELPGLVEERDGQIVLTRAGRLLANEVSLRLR
jgi:oxygen-independent coproporphyrinogen-3 oxidase